MDSSGFIIVALANAVKLKPQWAAKIPHLSMRDFYCLSVVTLILVLACCLALFAALDAGALVVLLLAEIGQHAGLGTAALEALERVIQRLVFLDVDFRHCIPSLQNVRRRS